MGKNIRDIISYDGIVEIKFDFLSLVIELFSKDKGNIILVDEERTILQPQEIQIWKDRRIIQKEKYCSPLAIDLSSLSFSDFLKMAKSSENEIGVFLAKDLGFGDNYAEEICLLVGVNKSQKTKEVKKLDKVYRTIKFFFEREIQPQVVYRDKEVVDVVPFSFKTYRNLKVKSYKTLNQAFDAYFTEKETLSQKEEESRIKEEGERKVEEIEVTSPEIPSETKDLIRRNYGLIESIFSGIQRAISAGDSWEEIKKRIRREDSEEARAIKEIKEDEGKVVIDLDGREVELDFRKSVEENIEDFEQISKPVAEEIEKEEKKGKTKWYENFHWFISSTNQLIVLGKDIASCEELIKKHLEPSDIVLHADLENSPFAIVKTRQPQSQETLQSIKEAGEFVASYSTAWQLNLREVDVYWVLPEQVSPNLVVKGRKNYLKRAETRLAIGVNLKERKILSGPLQAISKNADYFVTIQPGYTKARQLAEKIKEQWLLKAREEDKQILRAAPVGEIERLIPAGRGDLVEY